MKDQNINLKMKSWSMATYNNLMSQLTFKFPFKTKYYEQDFYVYSNNFSTYRINEDWPNWPGKVG